MKNFASKNLIMRPLTVQDKAMFCALHTDANSMRFIEPVYSREKALKAFTVLVKRNSNPDDYFNTWAIIRKNNDTNKKQAQQSIGFVMLYKKAGKQVLEVTEIGIMLLRQARGELLGQEAFGAMLSFGFNQLKLPYINVRFDKRKLATQRITRKVGFTYQQAFVDEVLLDNTDHASNDITTNSNSNSNSHTNNYTRLETISVNQWQRHSLQYPIKVKT